MALTLFWSHLLFAWFCFLKSLLWTELSFRRMGQVLTLIAQKQKFVVRTRGNQDLSFWEQISTGLAQASQSIFSCCFTRRGDQSAHHPQRQKPTPVICHSHQFSYIHFPLSKALQTLAGNSWANSAGSPTQEVVNSKCRDFSTAFVSQISSY